MRVLLPIALVFSLAPPAAAQAPPAACTWPVTFGVEEVNLLAPDSAADYWMAPYSVTPGHEIVIRGGYPDARYFSITVNDHGGITLGSLRDDRLVPDDGANPYLPPNGRPLGTSYTAHVVFDETDEERPNAFYAGRTQDGVPNAGGTIWYRVYVSGNGRTGGVPLPELTLKGPAGETPIGFRHCGSLPPDGSLDPANAVDHVARPDEAPLVPPRNADYADPPFFQVIHAGHPVDPVIAQLPPDVRDVAVSLKPRGVFLANADFPYMRSQITRAFGHVVVIRMRAPTFPDTRAGEPVWTPREVRYWSMCNYSAFEEGMLRILGCLTDHDATAGRDGFTYLVIADDAHRPDVDAPGIHHLDWGPYDKAMPFYRQGIASPDFEGSVGAVQAGTDPASVMGDYLPVARYCAQETIEQIGAAACFA